MKNLTPNIFVNDINQTAAFYRDLGFEVTMKVPEAGELNWVMMTNGSVSFMFQTFQSLEDKLPQVSRQNGGSLILYVQLEKIQDFFEKIKSKAKVLHGLEETFYGATEFSILDNNGYVLTFAEFPNQP